MAYLNFSLLIFLISFLVVSCQSDVGIFSNPTIQLSQGPIRGIAYSIKDGNETFKIHLYKGLKYGLVEQRFKKPLALISNWSEVYDATQERQSCPQISLGSKSSKSSYLISEDCLFLNVYLPAIYVNSTKNLTKSQLPVMVFIHGGGFQKGSSFDEKINASYITGLGKVIVVTINYRLGPFGFLFDGTDQAPGNQGIWDQLLALQWVSKNIHSFNGDPNQVTIFGQSGGALSVSALVVSPLSVGLFHRAIVESGTINTLSAFSNKFKALEKVEKLGRLLNCEIRSVSKIVECLRNKTVEEIVQASNANYTLMITDQVFQPIYAEDQLIPLDSARWKSFPNNVDLMFGTNRNEGTRFVISMVPKLKNDHKNYTLQSIKSILKNLTQKLGFDNIFQKKVAKFYTRNLTDSSQNVDVVRNIVADFIGHLRYICPEILFAEQMAQYYRSKSIKKNLFAFRLYRRAPNIPADGQCGAKWMGVCHQADIPYVFGHPLKPESTYPEEDKKLSRDMIRAWTRFAKTGRPGSMNQIEWLEALNSDKDNRSVPTQSVQSMKLDITYRMIENEFLEICDQFWKPQFFKN